MKRVVVKPYDRYKFEVYEDFNYQIELNDNEFIRLLNVNFATCFIFYHLVDKFHKLKCYFKGWK